jgi:hypothetical protein
MEQYQPGVARSIPQTVDTRLGTCTESGRIIGFYHTRVPE